MKNSKVLSLLTAGALAVSSFSGLMINSGLVLAAAKGAAKVENNLDADPTITAQSDKHGTQNDAIAFTSAEWTAPTSSVVSVKASETGDKSKEIDGAFVAKYTLTTDSTDGTSTAADYDLTPLDALEFAEFPTGITAELADGEEIEVATEGQVFTVTYPVTITVDGAAVTAGVNNVTVDLTTDKTLALAVTVTDDIPKAIKLNPAKAAPGEEVEITVYADEGMTEEYAGDFALSYTMEDAALTVTEGAFTVPAETEAGDYTIALVGTDVDAELTVEEMKDAAGDPVARPEMILSTGVFYADGEEIAEGTVTTVEEVSVGAEAKHTISIAYDDAAAAAAANTRWQKRLDEDKKATFVGKTEDDVEEDDPARPAFQYTNDADENQATVTVDTARKGSNVDITFTVTNKDESAVTVYVVDEIIGAFAIPFVGVAPVGTFDTRNIEIIADVDTDFDTELNYNWFTDANGNVIDLDNQASTTPWTVTYTLGTGTGANFVAANSNYFTISGDGEDFSNADAVYNGPVTENFEDHIAYVSTTELGFESLVARNGSMRVVLNNYTVNGTAYTVTGYVTLNLVMPLSFDTILINNDGVAYEDTIAWTVDDYTRSSIGGKAVNIRSAAGSVVDLGLYGENENTRVRFEIVGNNNLCLDPDFGGDDTFGAYWNNANQMNGHPGVNSRGWLQANGTGSAVNNWSLTANARTSTSKKLKVTTVTKVGANWYRSIVYKTLNANLVGLTLDSAKVIDGQFIMETTTLDLDSEIVVKYNGEVVDNSKCTWRLTNDANGAASINNRKLVVNDNQAYNVITLQCVYKADGTNTTAMKTQNLTIVQNYSFRYDSTTLAVGESYDLRFGQVFNGNTSLGTINGDWPNYRLDVTDGADYAYLKENKSLTGKKAGEATVRIAVYTRGANRPDGYGFVKFTVTGAPEKDPEAGDDVVESGVYAKLNADLKTVTVYAADAVNGVITIPAQVGGYDVTGIANQAFKGTPAKTIIVEAPVTAFGKGAFKNSKVKNLYFMQADKLTAAGKNSFKGNKTKIFSVGADFSADMVKTLKKQSGVKKVKNVESVQ